jgi:hypothetical protein
MFSLKVNQFLLLILLSSILFLSCSESTEPDSSTFSFIPLTIGNKWEYKVTHFDSTGNVTNQIYGTRTIFKDTVVKGITWYAYTGDFRGNWNTNKSDGYWVFIEPDSVSSINDTSWIVYKFPTHLGDIYGSTDHPTEVVSTNESISVPAGNFRTIHYRIELDDIIFFNYLGVSFDSYVCPGLGIVKTMQIGKKYDGTKFVVWQSELTNHNIKQNLSILFY